MFEPDVLLPRPIGGTDKMFALQPGSRKLMLAVLRDALDSALRSKDKQAPEDQAWLFSNRHGWPFDFLEICSQFKLDPGKLRADAAKLSVLRWLSKLGSVETLQPREEVHSLR